MPALSGAGGAALDAGQAVGAELDRYLAEGAHMIGRAEDLCAAMERAGAPEGHRLLAAQILLAMDRLHHGMQRHRAALAGPPAQDPSHDPARGPKPVPARPAARRPRPGWFGWLGLAARGSA